MTLLTFLAWAVAGIPIVPLAVLALELAAGVAPDREEVRPLPGGRVTVLIPAHNEEKGIAGTIAALKSVAPASTRILVVADNCDDQTASLSRLAGAETVERRDRAARGKGFALAFGRDHLAANDPPDIVVVLDADCRLAPGSLEALSKSVHDRGAPAQAVNLTVAAPGADPVVQMSDFAMMVKNLVRSRGMQRWGGAALLTGTGMAFPWRLFAQAGLASGSIVEDLDLGIVMTRSGHPPALVAGALVTSATAHRDDALEQRTRWEHGFLATLQRSALPTLLGGVTSGSRAEFALGLHLIVPPLALLMATATVTLPIVAGLAILGADTGPALVLTALLSGTLGLIGACWLAEGRKVLSVDAALRAPRYVLWKLPIYLGFLRRRSTEWTRTPRR